jgi:ABC-2 type transport system ATP-binding protein
VASSAPPVATFGLSKRFGPVTALDDLTLTLARGEVFGYLGPNGAGKTTTLRLLLGFLRPSAGRAEVFGTDVTDVARVHPRLAYVPGDVALWPTLTGTETLHLLARLHGSVDEAYRDELVERFELDPRRRSREYSKGNRQKVALVAAFATRAELLVLDEPTSGLDPLMEQQFRSCVLAAVERGQTVFLSSHLLSEVEALCHRVGILREGRLVEVADVDALRAMHGSVLEVDLVDGARPDLDALRALPEVSSVSAIASGVSLRLVGPPGPVLARLGAERVVGLRSREASLEEAFLAYYGPDGSAP